MKNNWVDNLKLGDMVSTGERGVSYAFEGIDSEGLYMLRGMPFGYEKYLMETFKLVRKKN